MPIIVDANVVDLVFFHAEDEDMRPVRTAVLDQKPRPMTLVYGGHLLTEYLQSDDRRRMLAVWDAAGRARAVPDDLVALEQEWVCATNMCKSDDPHVIALARAGNVRLLCSRDHDLHADFTNPELLRRPRGAVYQDRSHRHLLLKHADRV